MTLPKPTSRRCGLLLLLMCCLPAFAHNDPGYFHDSSDLPAQSDWMLAFDNNQPLRTFSLPGSHDSGATVGGPIVATQTLSIRQQLEAGVRFLDIRLRATGDSLAIHHSLVFQKLMFGDVLNAVQDFLAGHPGETVLMRVKEEYKAQSGSQPFVQIFHRYFERYRPMIAVPASLDVPLGQVRGKLVLLIDFAGGNDMGIAYSSATLAIQDDYQMKTNWSLYAKWLKVKNHLLAAQQNPRQMHINYLSASGGSFPYFVASGHSDSRTGAPRLLTGLVTLKATRYPDFPRVGCLGALCSIAFEGTNILTKDYLNGHVELTQVGIVVADFPGAGLIQSVIALNLRLAAQGGWQRHARGL
ncbi:phosphatidylinositol-specific phospholipase C [Pseudomonas sp. 5P_3.1_Bac2]|uniref:phosphatidylinositol-specific phospholipase C n=1 Tax=Pseudomonas sp. 5P_3.1_Bac2 TaxID=2971617 RepID=UPI0021CA5073|nr:phosphatidylinositol-specific phospholipase C [Pseudomonas sp. 5P_3.1_Bac2]MCU1719486.1 phosphatidylinositol-specific phospholipase C [Pseudomonas sp. 5P_3.1_Bac2]